MRSFRERLARHSSSETGFHLRDFPRRGSSENFWLVIRILPVSLHRNNHRELKLKKQEDKVVVLGFYIMNGYKYERHACIGSERFTSST